MNARYEQELLEAAAKAAGIEGQYWPSEIDIHRGIATVGGSRYWNPLNDDADALRLAVKLQIIVGKYDEYANAGGIGNDVDIVVWGHEEPDPYAATRRAIVRAAAEIGKSAATPND